MNFIKATDVMRDGLFQSLKKIGCLSPKLHSITSYFHENKHSVVSCDRKTLESFNMRINVKEECEFASIMCMFFIIYWSSIFSDSCLFAYQKRWEVSFIQSSSRNSCLKMIQLWQRTPRRTFSSNRLILAANLDCPFVYKNLIRWTISILRSPVTLHSIKIRPVKQELGK